MEIESKILLEENELKPNKYVANAALFSLPVILFCELLNEFGIFHVEPFSMRICFVITIFCSLAIQPFGRNQNLSRYGNAKYVILTLIMIETLAVVSIMAQWTELMIAFPLVIAMQYHNRDVMLYSVVGTLIVAFASSPISLLLETPQVNFYSFLINSIGFQIDALSPMASYDIQYYLPKVVLYISLPRCMVVGILSVVAFYVTKLTSANISNRIEVTYLSSTDVVTGIYNRLSYTKQIEEYEKTRPADLICVYLDADGLHELNNDRGHDAGDEMLKTCAMLLSSNFGPMTYRIGGDEFISFVETDNMEAVEQRLLEIQGIMMQHYYHASMGAAYLESWMSIDDLIKYAENKMYQAKRDFYENTPYDRRHDYNIVQT